MSTLSKQYTRISYDPDHPSNSEIVYIQLGLSRDFSTKRTVSHRIDVRKHYRRFMQRLKVLFGRWTAWAKAGFRRVGVLGCASWSECVVLV